jgi:hypothetical protein
VNKLVFIHSNLRLVDKVSNVDSAEQTIKWMTDDAVEETDSESTESDSDNYLL